MDTITLYCDECGHSWEYEPYENEDILEIEETCPMCGADVGV